MTTEAVDVVDEALSGQPLMKEFTAAQIGRLRQIARLARFAPDEIIHREGDECAEFFLVVIGQVAIELAGQHEVLRVETVGPGGEFGWSALLMGTSRYFQARALGEVRALAFDAVRLRQLCDDDPEFGYVLMRRLLAVVAGRLQSTRVQVADMHWTPAKRAGA